MKTYYFLDSEGCIFFTSTQEEVPEGGYELDFDIPPQPSEFFRFHVASKTWVDSRQNQDFAVEIKKKRFDLLLSSDWTQLPNNPLTPEKQAEWATYRQALRDITAQPGYPQSVVWPVLPQ